MYLRKYTVGVHKNTQISVVIWARCGQEQWGLCYIGGNRLNCPMETLIIRVCLMGQSHEPHGILSYEINCLALLSH